MNTLGTTRCGRQVGSGGVAAAMSTHRQRQLAGVTLRRARTTDCVTLADSLRAEDRAEIEALAGPSLDRTGRPCLEALIEAVAESLNATTAVDREGRVICMFGISPIGFLTDAGRPWLVCSDLVEGHSRLLARLAKARLPSMLERYPWLTGRIDGRRKSAVRFLEWLGFFVGATVTPIGGCAFRSFNLRKVH